MKRLGYPLTWRTTCFINDGCGEVCFAHTNGFGDFVLLDSLGWPWPIHPCYHFRQVRSGSVTIVEADYRTVSVELEDVPTVKQRISPSDITRANPAACPDGVTIEVAGYVQDICERRLDSLLSDIGGLGRQVAMKTFGSARSQLTIITSDYRSFSAFADLSATVLSCKAVVMARIKAIRTPLPRLKFAFLCTDLLVVNRSGRS